jgi:hypothetical protein
LFFWCTKRLIIHTSTERRLLKQQTIIIAVVTIFLGTGQAWAWGPWQWQGKEEKPVSAAPSAQTIGKTRRTKMQPGRNVFAGLTRRRIY